MVEETSVRYFATSFRDRRYLEAWYSKNNARFAFRPVPKKEEEEDQKTKPPQIVLPQATKKQPPKIARKRSHTPPQKKPPRKKTPIIVMEKASSSSGSDTEPDTKQSEAAFSAPPQSTPPPQPKKSQGDDLVSWFFSGPNKHPVLTLSAPQPNHAEWNVTFDDKCIFYFKTMYHLQRLPDGAAVGDTRMCKKVNKKIFFSALFILFCC